MRLFFFWALTASVLMALAAIPAFMKGGLSGDASIVFGFVSLAGIPAWLIVAGLTISRWRSTSGSMVTLHNAPAALAVILYAVAQLQWAL
jgi:hypothetical protein